jgi:hypothetical protein
LHPWCAECEVDEEAADINGDVKIGSTDYILAKRYILEDITDFPI